MIGSSSEMAMNLIVSRKRLEQRGQVKIFSGEGRFAEARRAKNAQIKIPEKGVSRNARGRLSMEELSMVFEDRLIE